MWRHLAASDALWQESEKLNKNNRPYKDVVALEKIDAPATTSSSDNTDVLAELRAIRALLQVLTEAQGLAVPEPDPSGMDSAFPRYGDGSMVSENPAEQQAFSDYVATRGIVPENVDALREWHKANHL